MDHSGRIADEHDIEKPRLGDDLTKIEFLENRIRNIREDIGALKDACLRALSAYEGNFRAVWDAEIEERKGLMKRIEVMEAFFKNGTSKSDANLEDLAFDSQKKIGLAEDKLDLNSILNNERDRISSLEAKIEFLMWFMNIDEEKFNRLWAVMLKEKNDI